MDKLVERETATRNPVVAAPALAVQFFLIPLAVVAITVGVYVGFRSLLADSRSPQQYLAEVRNGGSDRRWPAAYELSRLMADPKVRADRTLAPELVNAFQASKGDPQVRRYLALAIGRMDPPLPAEAVARHGSRDGRPVLRQMLDRPYVEQTVKRETRVDDDQDPIADVMISGLRAAASLKDEDLRKTIGRLSESDKSMKVRQAALEAMKVLGAQKMQVY